MDFKELLAKTYADDDEFAEKYKEMLHDDRNSLVLDNLEIKLISNQRHNSDKIVIFTYNDKYYEVLGSYDSWNGTEFYDPTDVDEVKPVQKVITEYVHVK